MSRNRLRVFGVEKARLKLARRLRSGVGLNTIAARGEKIRSSSL
jgi:hypothetical protein